MSDTEFLRISSIKSPDNVKQTRRRSKRKRHVLIRMPDGQNDRSCRFRTKLLIAGLALAVFAAGACAYTFTNSKRARKMREPPDPETPLPPSPSTLHVFHKAAVCTDAPYCSEVGREILRKNGTAVDAAIAAMFCNGILNQQSMGIGGGFFMTVFIRDEAKAYSVNARERAPIKATLNMFHGSTTLSSKGKLAVGVPGELRGMYRAWQRWGRLPWSTLVEPTIELCTKGYTISKALYDGLILAEPYSKHDALIRKQYVNPKTGQFYKEGAQVKPSEPLCKTFREIAARGGDDLYNGTLAQDFLDDLNKVGTLIGAEDLSDYEPKITDPIKVPIGNGDVLYTPPLPSSGVVLIHILNILSGYNFTAASICSLEEKVLTYHRIIEAFKYAYAMRTKLGDSDFLEVEELIKNITNPKCGNNIRLRINDTWTSNDTAWYGVMKYNKPDAGTAHISVIAPNGDAVSMTSSINHYFGAGFTTLKTGIVMNNVMDDFSSPGLVNYFGLEPSPANYIEPKKRPLSSMCPSIIVDSSGNAKLVIGASGGTKITSAVAFTAMNKLWFGLNIKEAVDSPRIHHQIFPMQVQHEYGVTKDILDGLRAKGHEVSRYKGRGSIVCALYRNVSGIYANSDFRKGGDVAGLN